MWYPKLNAKKLEKKPISEVDILNPGFRDTHLYIPLLKT